MSSSHQILTEIVEKITIESDLTISHPDYPALNTDPDTIDKLGRLSGEIKTRYLITQVQTYLHDIYFTHRSISHQEAADRPQIVKNNMIDGIDINFYPQLQQHNTSSGYLDSGWQILATTDRAELVVIKDGLQLHIDPRQHLAPEFRQATPGMIVPIYLPPNLAGQDTYIAIGNAGSPSSEQSIQIYFNFTPEAAVKILRQLTRNLNRLQLPFQFAILHDQAIFHRWDAGVLSLDRANYDLIQPVLADIYKTHQTAFSPSVPLFSKQLAPGLGLVEVPIDSDYFGLHRCYLIATGLVAAIDHSRATRERGQTSAADKLNRIRQEFIDADLDLSQPYLNPGAIDSYPHLFG